ncbi:glucan endo-1,3-beta-glucosidase 4-like [Wolffia australiana]
MTFEECRATLFLVFLFSILLSNATGSFVGFNVRGGPPAPAVVSLLKKEGIRHVRLLDVDHALLTELSGSVVEVMVSVPNADVGLLGSSTSAAAEWVKTHVATFVPLTNITAVAVGDEAPVNDVLVNAVKNVHAALVAADLNLQVKVSSPLSMEVISQPFPPSTAVFNDSWRSAIGDLLQFLKSTGSSFMLNASPYRGYVSGGGVFPLEYALMKPLTTGEQIVDPNTLTSYESMFEAMVSAAVFSMAALNWTGIPMLVTETGWPWRGGRREATTGNARAYTGNLVQHVLGGGGAAGGAYVYELYAGGSTAGEEWGVFFENGTAAYEVDLGSWRSTTGELGGVFCVANRTAGQVALKAALDWACGVGRADCAAVQPGRACYGDISTVATYVFNDYYHRTHAAGGTCDFGGAAFLTAADPSHGACAFAGRSADGKQMTSQAMGPVPPVSEGSPAQRAVGTAAGTTSLLLLLLVHLLLS